MEENMEQVHPERAFHNAIESYVAFVLDSLQVPKNQISELLMKSLIEKLVAYHDTAFEIITHNEYLLDFSELSEAHAELPKMRAENAEVFFSARRNSLRSLFLVVQERQLFDPSFVEKEKKEDKKLMVAYGNYRRHVWEFYTEDIEEGRQEGR